MKGLTIAAAIAAGVVAGAQDRKPDTPTDPSSSAVTVSGCLRGAVLEPERGTSRATAEALMATEFDLEGAKDLMQMLRRDHNGHRLEITGVVKIPPDTTGERIDVKTTDLGRAGRITIGSREQKGFVPTPPRPVRLVVQSFRHLADSCARR
jgi:hypothetical protein